MPSRTGCARNVPYVFLTGYGKDILPDGHRDRLVVLEPFEPRQVVKAMTQSIVQE